MPVRIGAAMLMSLGACLASCHQSYEAKRRSEAISTHKEILLRITELRAKAYSDLSEADFVKLVQTGNECFEMWRSCATEKFCARQWKSSDLDPAVAQSAELVVSKYEELVDHLAKSYPFELENQWSGAQIAKQESSKGIVLPAIGGVGPSASFRLGPEIEGLGKIVESRGWKPAVNRNDNTFMCASGLYSLNTGRLVRRLDDGHLVSSSISTGTADPSFQLHAFAAKESGQVLYSGSFVYNEQLDKIWIYNSLADRWYWFTWKENYSISAEASRGRGDRDAMDQYLNPLAAINIVSVSPDGRLAATATQQGIIRIWDVRGGFSLRTIKVPEASRALAFSPSGQVMAIGCDDRSVRLMQIATGKMLAELQGHEKPVIAVSFLSDGKTLGSCDETEIKLWNAPRGSLIRSIASPDRKHVSASFDSSGDLIATCSEGKGAANPGLGYLDIFDARSGERITTLTTPAETDLMLEHVVFSPSGKWLVATGLTGAKAWKVTRDSK